MSMSDPLGDMLTRIRNAQSARQSRCKAPASGGVCAKTTGERPLRKARKTARMMIEWVCMETSGRFQERQSQTPDPKLV